LLIRPMRNVWPGRLQPRVTVPICSP
jgi:hypothetical protein